MADEVERVARGLSAAQVKAVLILSGNWASRPMPERMTWLDPSILEITAPLRTGHERVRLTPFGVAVQAHLRTYLKDQTNGQG